MLGSYAMETAVADKNLKVSNMPIKNKILTTVTMVAFLISTIVVMVPQGNCITLQEERELSKEFMAVVRAQFPLIEGGHLVLVGILNRVFQSDHMNGFKLIDLIENCRQGR